MSLDPTPKPKRTRRLTAAVEEKKLTELLQLAAEHPDARLTISLLRDGGRDRLMSVRGEHPGQPPVFPRAEMIRLHAGQYLGVRLREGDAVLRSTSWHVPLSEEVAEPRVPVGEVPDLERRLVEIETRLRAVEQGLPGRVGATPDMESVARAERAEGALAELRRTHQRLRVSHAKAARRIEELVRANAALQTEVDAQKR